MDKPYCKLCGNDLRVGDNWRPSVAKLKHYRCNKCISKNRRHYYLENKEHIAKIRKTYRSQSPENSMYTRIKTRAKKCNIPFNLEKSDIVIPECCPIFNVPFVIGEKSPHNPSLDRIDPSKGYVKGNVIVISVRANSIKNDATPQELRRIADFVDQLLVSRYG